MYLLEGEPGTGKTTIALQFLLAGRDAGESVLYVTLSETSGELSEVASSHHWNLDGVEVVDLDRDFARHEPENQYTVFESSEVELGDTIQSIYDAARRTKPRRLVIDSLSEFRLLCRDTLRFRRELLAMKRFFAELDTTILLLDDQTLDLHGGLIQSIAHGVLRLERVTTEYGAERRRAIIPKLRGARFREGYHDYRIEPGGVSLFPRLIAAEHRSPAYPGEVLSGLANLDNVLGGGLVRGTSTIIVGPSGAGKSTMAAVYACAAAKQGERVEIFLFDENMGTYFARAKGLNLPLQESIDKGLITVRQFDPSEVSPGEFVQLICQAVEERGAKHIVVDSLTGLVQAMPGEQTLVVQIHEVLSYLSQSSVTTLLTIAQHGLMGPGMASAADLSYLADTLILLRFFEAYGEIRKSVSVIKKRTGEHELTVRELRVSSGGFEVGEPLRDFQGIFTGVPRFVGKEGGLFDASRG